MEKIKKNKKEESKGKKKERKNNNKTKKDNNKMLSLMIHKVQDIESYKTKNRGC